MDFTRRAGFLFYLSITAVLFSSTVAAEPLQGQRAAYTTASRSKLDSADILGFGILSRIPGLWHGPVSSTTPAGSFDIWYVDFRPVSPSQISQYSTLDPHTLNYISFFIVKHDDRLRVAMRTEGVFQNKGCVTYEVLDEARESEGYYRFSDFQSGTKRAYTEFTFVSEDEFVMEVFTNKFNKVFPLELHSRWNAKRGDLNAAREAIKHFDFPQPIMVKDFSDVFGNRFESIYFSTEDDPYDSSSQPYVSTVRVNIRIDRSLPLESDHELFLLLTTESLFDGLKYIKENMKYVSKYAFMPVDTKSYTFDNVHPGQYYLYSYNDINGDRHHLSGDYMSSDLDNSFTVNANGTIEVDTTIDFILP